MKRIPQNCGVEIDVRFDNSSGQLYLHHDNLGSDEIRSADTLPAYLQNFEFNPQRIVIFNIKDSGSVKAQGPGKDVEWECLRLAEQFGIPKSNYFLLDVEFPFIYYATAQGVREIAIRYSEAEVKEQFLYFKTNTRGQRANWVWIDVNTELPLNPEVIKELDGFRTCLVCPERWGRPDDIEPYAERIAELGFQLDAVMTNEKYVERWMKTGVVKASL